MATVQAWETAYQRYANIRLGDGESSSDGMRRSWIMLMPEGTFRHPEYGKLNFAKRRLAEFKQNFDAKVRKIDIALDRDHDAKAATGWLEAIKFGEDLGREPGLWGLVRWTKIGAELINDQIYRYFSPEFGTYTDEESGQVYHDVIIGGALTNRPFLKVMTEVTLAEVSTRPWSSVDKTKLPDSCFLDSTNRRLPVYEGTGPIGKDGRYTKRGKLNINGLHAAKAAVHGAHTGKPMSGLPGGVAARIERLLARYEGSQKASEDVDEWKSGGTMKRTTSNKSILEIDDENRRIFMGGKGTPPPADDDADGEREHQMDDGSSDDSESYDDDESMDDGTDTDGESGNDEDQPLPSKAGKGGKGGKGTKKASESSYFDAEDQESETVTLREQQLARRLAETQRQMVEMKRKQYATEVRAILSGWDAGEYQFVESKIKNPDAGTTRTRQARVALSRPAREAIGKFLLSERTFRMSEESREEICRLFELAAKGAVDLSARGGSFDQEERRTIRSGGQPLDSDEQERALEEQVEVIALSEYRKPVSKLTHIELAEAQQKAAEIVGYR